jgi:hypothetical protein
VGCPQVGRPRSAPCYAESRTIPWGVWPLLESRGSSATAFDLLTSLSKMQSVPTDTDQQKTVELVKTPPMESGAVLRRKTPVLEFSTSVGKASKPDDAADFLDASDVADDVAPRRAPPLPQKPLYPVIDRIVRRTRVEARETRAGTPWWLAAVVVGGLAIVGAAAGLTATGRLGSTSPAVAASVVGRTASVVAGRFTISTAAAPALAVGDAPPIVKAAWSPRAADPARATEHPLAAAHLVPTSHGTAHGMIHHHGAKLHPKKSHPTTHV